MSVVVPFPTFLPTQPPPAVSIQAAASAIGVSVATLKRWFKAKKIGEVGRDRNGYRFFTPLDLEVIATYAHRQSFAPRERFVVRRY